VLSLQLPVALGRLIPEAQLFIMFILFSSKKRMLGRITASNSAFLLCDIQGKFRNGIVHFDRVVSVAKRMTAVSSLLKIPLIGERPSSEQTRHLNVRTTATEQYPQGLGKLVDDIVLPPGTPVFSKTTFSMMTDDVNAVIAAQPNKIDAFVLFGIETHACVQATALDLLEQGKQVHVLVDGCSSRSKLDRSVALNRIERAGGLLTTSESILFQLMKDAKHPAFKDVQKLIMTPTPQEW